jgi:hypothetical protein
MSADLFNAETGKWSLTIDEIISKGLTYTPKQHSTDSVTLNFANDGSGLNSSLTFHYNPVVNDVTTLSVANAVGLEDTDIALPKLSTLTTQLIDQDGSETFSNFSLTGILCWPYIK